MLFLFAIAFAASKASLDEDVESTPLPPPAIPKTAIISEPFPLNTVGLNFINSSTFLFLKPLAPAPTGSKTQGTLFLFAKLAASNAHSCQYGSNVPILIVNAPLIALHIWLKSFASSFA